MRYTVLYFIGSAMVALGIGSAETVAGGAIFMGLAVMLYALVVGAIRQPHYCMSLLRPEAYLADREGTVQAGWPKVNRARLNRSLAYSI